MPAVATATVTATNSALQLCNSNITNSTNYPHTSLPHTLATMASATASVDMNRLRPLLTTANTAVGHVNGLFYVEHDAASDAYDGGLAPSILYHSDNEDNDVDDDGDDDADADDDDDNDVDVKASSRHVAEHGLVPAAEDADDGDETDDSCGSMETVSDNVAIWVDGEKHWISGVDANTTCADLIGALLNYLHGQQLFSGNKSVACNTNSNGNTESNNGHPTINQSMTKQTKEDCKTKTEPTTGTMTTTTMATSTPPQCTAAALACEYVIVKQHRHCEEYLDGHTKVFDVLPARDMPARKECELLLRRLAAPGSVAAGTMRLNTQVSSLLSTDKDSGMGSPVGSSRSARFRRRKHKSTTSSWLAQGNTLHPKVSQRGLGEAAGTNANERLLKIILAQDETIHRQLTLLREKERQISKIEEEKHRVRERELGKNYLLETYLNGLDEADVEPDPEAEEGEVEIFIDEPYQRQPTTATSATPAATPKAKGTPETVTAGTQLRPCESKQQKLNHDEHMLPPTANIDVVVVPSDSPQTASKRDIELQLFWLEKIYTLNKQLQREEELLVKLHAKVRKHQVKRAYQTKREVLQQIDKLEADLTLQCCDIRAVEDKLHASNEQLKHKLDILEALSQEYMATEQAEDNEALEIAEAPRVADEPAQMSKVSRIHEPCKAEILIACQQQQQQQILAAGTISAGQQQEQQQQLQQLSSIETTQDVHSLSQVIAKPIADNSTTTTMTAAIASTLLTGTIVEPALLQQQLRQLCTSPHGNYPISCTDHAVMPASSNLSISTQFKQQQPLINHINTSYNDKNLLPPLQACNTKTVKKQMFDPKLLQQQRQKTAVVGTSTNQPNSINATTLMPTTTTAAIIHTHRPMASNEVEIFIGGGGMLPASATPPLPTITTPLDRRRNIDITQLGTLV